MTPAPRDPSERRLAAPALFLGLLAVLILPAAARAEDRSTLLPTAWGGAVSVGYDRNVLRSSHAEEAAFGTGDPNYYFVVDRLNDWRGQIGLWAQWDVPSFYKSLRVLFGYERTDWAHDQILANNRYDLSIRQKLPDRSRVDLSVRFEPQAYLRHRVDKDAGPGEPRFRPEAIRNTEIELSHERSILGLPITTFAGYAQEDRTRWFRERDEKSVGVGASLNLRLGETSSITPLFGHNESRSRNKPDVGSDRSYREEVAGIRLRTSRLLLAGVWNLEAGTKWKFRTYTTNDPSDQSRYHRHDRTYGWSVRLARASEPVAPFLLLEGTGRLVDLPRGADASDEDGEYEGFLVRTGIEWEL